jgi:hypothetical protein
MVYDNSNPRQLLAPDGAPALTVDPVTCDVVVRFAAPTTFYVAINGGTGPQGPTGATGSSGTNANVAVTTGALKGNGAGSAVAVTGTATDCVRVDGSSGACGSGGGSVTAGAGISVNGSTISFNPLDRSVLWKVDNFCGGEFPSTTVDVVGELGWHLGVTNTGSASISNLLGTDIDVNHPCGIKVVTPASPGNGSYLELFGGILSNVMTPGAVRPTTIEYQFKLSSTSNIKFYLSLLSAAPYSVALGNLTAGCWLRYDTSLGTPDTGWMAVCSDGSTQTALALGGTLDTNIHRVTLTWTAAGSYSFAMDGGTPTVISKAVPGGGSLKTGVGVSNDGTSTTSAVYIYKFVMLQTGLVVN